MDRDFRFIYKRLTGAMKKLFFAMFLIVLLIGSFLGGTWYSRQGAGKNSDKERRILHYVDPMNPVNVSDKPGIAPCGMPMEPVYGNEEPEGTNPAGMDRSMSPGTVKISPQKQQIIGVQVGVVERNAGYHELRTLGRVTPDENRVYPVIAATDGWLGDIQRNTTGSQVKKGQLMAKINIFSYDFFTWQQRFLTEFAGKGQRRTGTPAETRQTEAIAHGTPRTAAQQPGIVQPGSQISEAPFPEMNQPDISQPSASQPETRQSKARPPAAATDLTRTGIITRDNLEYRTDAATLYSNKSKLELLNLGVGEAQLDELARTTQYISAIELRSPAAGLVISRGISAYQRVDRGTECFRVADMSRVWIIADVFNAEAPYIRPGLRARISLPGQGRHYEATVSDVLPKFDAATRSLKVRLEMDNPKNVLLPEMVVDVTFPVPLPAATTVPASAILDSGLKKTVFLSLGDGFFEPRTIKTGWRYGDRVEILKGLMPGDPIVTSGTFLIDSESRMRLAAANHD